MGIMHKHVAPVLAAVAALGVVGGVAYAQAFGGGSEPEAKPQVQLVQPAAQTVTSSPTVTATPSPTTAPKVESKPKASTTSEAPAPVQEAVVPKSEPAPETTSETTPSEPATEPSGPPAKPTKPRATGGPS